jgi:tetratricopeptide (TPR) repeat protein
MNSRRAQPQKQSSRAPQAGVPRRATLVAAVALVALTVVTYSPVWNAQFITDDDINVTVNPTLHSVAGLRDMWLVPTSAQQYYPVTYTTFWIERRLWGFDPRGYHVVNVLIHATSAILLWRVLLRLGVPGAWLAAAIFAVHPVGVESVAWITERRNVLSLLLALGSLLSFPRFALADKIAGEQRRSASGAWYVASLILFAAALLSKTAVVTLPAVILVIHWWQRGRVTKQDILRTIPFFMVAIASGCITLWLEQNHVGAQGAEFDLTPIERLLVAGRAFWFYVAKLVWPYPTLFFYPRWVVDPAVWWQWLFPAAALALPVFRWVARKRLGRGPLAAALIYAGVLMPTIGFINVYFHTFSFVADHFQYHASPALFALTAAGGAMFYAHVTTSRFLASLVRVMAAAVILVLAVLSFRAAGHFHDEETLDRYVVAKNPGSWIAWSNLGLSIGSEGRYDEALAALRRALELDPAKSRVQYNYAKLLLDRGERDGYTPDDIADALAHFQEAARLLPGWAAPEVGIGVALWRNRRPEEALTHLERALAIEPRNIDALRALGTFYSERGELDRAREFLDQAVAQAPEQPEVHLALGRVMAEQGELLPAAAELAEAVRLRPDDAAAWNNSAVVYARLGQIDRAVECFRQVVRIEPDSPAAAENLAKALEWQRQAAGE